MGDGSQFGRAKHSPYDLDLEMMEPPDQILH